MKIYLVGGAVRDELLGRPVKERDWVVVGATPEAMQAQGFKQVGKDFPVFLHPRTGEEYALARTERKTSPGYRGFAVHAAPDVSLEQDLLRRDLTINALARDDTGHIIDPYGGLQDLENRLLRHVSNAFAEDPVRILRTARFAARYTHLGFRIAPETNALMQAMAAAGEVDALVPERVWQELVKALAEETPSRFFEALRDCNALGIIFPEIGRLFGVPQPEVHHPEIDTGVHSLMVLDQAARLSPDPRVRFAALTHDLGKGLTSAEILPSHHGHEDRGAVLAEQLCRRLKAPNDYRDLALLTARYHGHIHRAGQLRPETALKVLEACDAFRRPERFEHLLIACEADARGRKGFEERPYPQAGLFRRCLSATRTFDPAGPVREGLKGEALRDAIRKGRLGAIKMGLTALP
ncbi:MAG: multifunctional CCA tRNA nucleotidyl transferase/2'3'-cyclic phosphodiesterase/2'nucleotidase/phosphatase [Gammaproteobacteria bacterium RIFOXYA12_FULL_61_12]|nr:MAG: multifunctional CCA tRNA nucleotidyl transferase/2'3'-cyclic phosphodiesterase/2'nucleotidase/phosphatase [Gammaproteobacteria bacterium RIFOXYD12_FULL_61_37]OGT94646.1 MAG: multifunctional CCA tRNA nucleotidyl transferase/2'3'-cyclic phosphodiesterase/2'nucleotidase/phosphatase [Gammaproteobacteria bacterium RIFOXYA12_FULL_61_12]